MAARTWIIRRLHPDAQRSRSAVRPSRTICYCRLTSGNSSPSSGPLEGHLSHFQNHQFWRLVLLAMLVPLVLVAFWPSPVDQPVQSQLGRILQFLHGQGIPAWFNYQFVEASANVVFFIPVGIVSSLAFPAMPWWRIGAFGLLISGCMELCQFLFLHNRFASPLDLVTNASGAVIGALVAVQATKWLQARCTSTRRVLNRRTTPQ